MPRFTGEQLKLAREQAGLSQRQLARECKYAGFPIWQPLISDIEMGRVEPTDLQCDTIAMICRLVTENRAEAVKQALQAEGECVLQEV